MLQVFEQLMVLILLMGAGVVLAKLEILNEVFLEGLNKFLVCFTLPCMIFNSLQQVYSEELVSNMLSLFGISAISFSALILAIEIWGKMSKMPKSRSGMYQHMIVIGNTGFMGLPVMQALLGELGLFYGSIFCIPNTFVMFTYGRISMARGSNERLTLKKLLYNPSLIATLVGILMFACQFELPYVIARPIEWIGDMTIPISLLIVGSCLAKCHLKELMHPAGIWMVTLLRLIVLPAIMGGLLYLFGARGVILLVPTVMFGMPVGLLAEVFAIEYHNDVFTVGKAVMLSHLLSIITLPLLVMILMPLAG